MVKIVKKTLEAMIALGLTLSLISCTNIHLEPKNFDQAIESYKQRCSIAAKQKKPEQKEQISFPQELLNPKDWKLSLDFDSYKKPKENYEFYIEMNAPLAYRLKDEKREVKSSNKLISILGFGKNGKKITSFSDRNPEENAALYLGFKKKTKLIDPKYGDLYFRGGICYGKDTIENHIPHKFLPLTLDVDITDTLYGGDLGFIFEPKLNPDKSLDKLLKKYQLQPYLEGILSYKHLDVKVNTRLNTIPLSLNYDSNGNGFGVAIRTGIKTHLKYFPKDSTMGFFIGARYEKIGGNQPCDNVGFEGGITLCVPIK